MQSRKWSLIEAVANLVLGFAIALGSQLVIFYFYGVELALSTNVAITCWFTLVSMVRSYTLRRLFNRINR